MQDNYIPKGWVWNGKYYATREALEKDKNSSPFIIKKFCCKCKNHMSLLGGKYLNKTTWICRKCK